MTAIDLGLPTRLVELDVDGQTVAVPEGSTILDAVRETGDDLPVLCYGDTLTPKNACRICMVELEGSRTLVPSCARRVEADMVVHTQSDRARHSRKLVLELLASSVDLSTTPGVPEWTEEYAAEPERFGEPAAAATGNERDVFMYGEEELLDPDVAANVHQPDKVDNDLYVREYSKCILCYKCVDACGEQWQNSFAINVAGRGFDSQISTEFAIELPESACVFCGNCVEVCPTGALSFNTEYDMRKEGTWDESKQSVTQTVCTFCGVGCNLELHVQDNNIVKVSSPHDHSVTHGNLCIKGRFGYQHVQNREPEGDHSSS